MSFLEEVKREVGITDMQLLSGFSYVNFCGETLYLEGVKDLREYRTTAWSCVQNMRL